jgi:chromosome segregation ATPase
MGIEVMLEHRPSVHGEDTPEAKLAQLTTELEQTQAALEAFRRTERERVEALLQAKDRLQYEVQLRLEVEDQLRREKERLERERAERRRLEEKLAGSVVLRVAHVLSTDGALEPDADLQTRLAHLERTEAVLREGIAFLQGEVAVRDQRLEQLRNARSLRVARYFGQVRSQLLPKRIIAEPYRIVRSTYHRLAKLWRR